MAHIQAGAKKVVISAPAGNDLKTIVYSVNEKPPLPVGSVVSSPPPPPQTPGPMSPHPEQDLPHRLPAS